MADKNKVKKYNNISSTKDARDIILPTNKQLRMR